MLLRLRKGSTNTVEIRSLKNTATGQVDPSAVIEVTVLDANEIPVPGEAWPKTLAHVADGLYRSTLSHEMDLSPRLHYTARVIATSAGGQVRRWACPVEVVEC